VNGAQDSSSFILLREQSTVFQISYTNCPGNVCPGKVCPGKWLSGKRLIREIIDVSGTQTSGKRLSRKVIVRETSVTRM